MVAVKTEIKITPQSNSPHQVSYGIMLLFIEYEDAKTEIILVITIIVKKNDALIVVIPATKHKISSGKNGNKNINVNIILSFPFIIFRPLFKPSSPTSHLATLKPNILPI